MEDENLLVPNLQNNEEETSEYSLRPKTLKEYIGQTKVKENMKILTILYLIGVLSGIIIDLIL